MRRGDCHWCRRGRLQMARAAIRRSRAEECQPTSDLSTLPRLQVWVTAALGEMAARLLPKASSLVDSWWLSAPGPTLQRRPYRTTISLKAARSTWAEELA